MKDQLERAFQEFEGRLIQWGQAQEDVRGIIIIGSRARQERPADAWSDMDVILLVKNPEHYICTTDWLNPLGKVQVTFLEGTATGDGRERRVLFDGAVDVDFVPKSSDFIEHQQLPAVILEQVNHHIKSGMRILVDKDGFSDFVDTLRNMPESTPTSISEDDFLNTANDFWYHCVWVAKKLRRGESLTAMGGLHYLLNQCLLPMSRYHALATHGNKYNIWHKNRFFEIWVDQRVRDELRGCYAHYDHADIWRALFACMELFSWLCPETAEKLTYDYPLSAENYTRDWVMRCFDSAK